MIKLKIASTRSGIADEYFDVEDVPRNGDLIITQHMAVARVSDVWWNLPNNSVTVFAG